MTNTINIKISNKPKQNNPKSLPRFHFFATQNNPGMGRLLTPPKTKPTKKPTTKYASKKKTNKPEFFKIKKYKKL